jgi:hypothetical protein
LVAILSVAAIVTWFEQADSACLVTPAALGITPRDIPLAKLWSDNMNVISWVSKVSAKSARGQPLVRIYAELEARTPCGFPIGHIPGVDNVLADFISRPDDISLSLPLRHAQIFQYDKRLKSYNYFQPSPALILLLESALFTNAWAGRPRLPSSLGLILPAASTTSYLLWP